MTKEEKILLLQDLCARLPYGVRVWYKYRTWYSEKFATSIRLDEEKIALSSKFNKEGDWFPVEEASEILIKPYLRPLSSMTDEEKKELRQEQIKDEQLFADCIKNHPEMRGKVIPHFAADWCNKHHFNYRLPEHLFITVTETNNPYKV